jgi:ribose 5-phosphate isomerase B
MIIYIGADHRGFQLKEKLTAFLKEKGYPVFDVGASSYDPTDDYPDFAEGVARKVGEMLGDSAGILICGSGAGVCVTANKFKNIRAAMALSAGQVKAARSDDHTNVLCLASDFTSEEEAQRMIAVWLETSFSEEARHLRRIKKISQLEG